MHTDDAPIIIEPTTPARRAVIWLHGLGADGHDFAGIESQLGLPADHGIRFIYPHAPMRPVTINGGYVMRAWYDIYELGPGMREDQPGITASAASVLGMIQGQLDQGIAPRQIVLAGFSQGGAVALFTVLSQELPLAGVLALSTYLPVADHLCAVATDIGRAVPVWMAHGDQDPVVPMVLGERSRGMLQDLGVSVQWHSYPMPHSVCPQEINDLAVWLRQRLLS